jgi:hypothetical protein
MKAAQLKRGALDFHSVAEIGGGKACDCIREGVMQDIFLACSVMCKHFEMFVVTRKCVH